MWTTTASATRRPVRILFLEDSDADAELLERELRKAGIVFEKLRVDTRESFLEALAMFAPDLVLADFSLPAFDGLNALKIARSLSQDLPFLLVSGSVGEEMAIDILRNGATDYVLKHRLTRLAPAVKRALAEAEERIQRRAAESALASRAADLERSNADLEQFAYACSHDLREPLRVISAFADLILEQGQLDECCSGWFRRVVEGSQRMRRLIDGVLEYSLADTRAAPRAPCDSSRALRAALDPLSTLLRSTGAVVTNADLPVVLIGETQLARVFENLVANGVTFNSSRPPSVHVEAQSVGDEWVFSVRDNGIGIPPEARMRVFKMFERLHSRAEFHGEGMGLAICKKIIERNGGRIWIEGNSGGGSVIRFALAAES